VAALGLGESLNAPSARAAVADEELDPILIQVTVPLPTAMILSAFTEPEHLKGWLLADAEVEAHVGGRYRLKFSGETPFESVGTIQKLTPETDVEFDWQAPPAFAALMNGPPSRTRVYIRLQESPEGVDVTLEHSGWGSGEAWEDARSWHFHFWDERLHELRPYLLKVAYG
jgi:uncharacterized protein YndB with AHSA1/START domain